MDRVFTVHAGSRGCNSHRRHVRTNFSDAIDQDICTQCALSWKIVVSEWRWVIAVSMNVGSGFRLIKPAILYISMQTHYKHDEDGCTAPGGHGSVPLSHFGKVNENWVTQHNIWLKCSNTLEIYGVVDISL